MSGPVLLGVGVLGGLGAVARVLLDESITARVRSDFPYGILAVNLLGAFVLGILVGAALDDDVLTLFGTGFLGAFTTFSTWMLDTHRLPPRAAARNVGVGLVAGVGLALLGRELGGL